MGTCDEGNPTLETPNGITLQISSNGTRHDVVEEDDNDDHQDQNQNQPPEDETPAIVDKLETLQLKANGGGAHVEEEGEGEESGGEKEEVETHNYPLRPDAMNCTFYIRTGSCKFGQDCRFNHPPNRAIQPAWDKEKGAEESNGSFPDTGRIECKYFSTPGGCKYGDACRYNHSRERIEAKGLELNFLGLPIRPLEKECTFYMRNGTCKYGANCRYHHPDPTSAKEFDGNSPANGSSLRGDSSFHRTYETPHSSGAGAFQGSLRDQSNGMNLRDSLPYAANMSSYHHGMLQNPGWIQNQVTMSLPTNMAHLSHQIVNNFSKTSDPSTHFEPVMHIDEFPVRPGQPNCDYFMKTGDCKYRSACRYNHPASRTSKLHLPSLSVKGSYPRSATVLPVETTELPNLNPNNARKNGVPHHQQMQDGEFPERPGLPECEYFMKTGNCKFRSACRYHHPKNRVSTSSSTALNEKGLPLRPGSRICRNYEQQGTCKYGSNCLFHHPDDNSSASEVSSPQDHSSTDVPVTVTDSEVPKNSNDASDWGDGWAL